MRFRLPVYDATCFASGLTGDVYQLAYKRHVDMVTLHYTLVT